MKEGFYRIDYVGTVGRGFGIIVLDTQVVVGTDMAGGLYDGTYQFNPDTNMLEAKIKVTIPAGAWLVQGIPAQDKKWNFEFEASFRRETTETPVTVQTPFGPVNVVFRYLRGFPS